MTTSSPILSVVIPVYNGALCIAETIQSICAAMPRDEAWEVVVVNDGSTDATRHILSEIAPDFPCLRVVECPDNMGKGYAVKAGMREARGAYVAFTDADLPYGVEAIHRMESAAMARPYVDFFYGSRSHPSSSEKKGYGMIRRCGRAFVSAFVRGLVAPEVRDTQCGVKMLSRSFVVRVLRSSSVDRFAFDVELFAIQKAGGVKSESIPVTLNHRKESSVRIFRDTFGMMRDIWKIHRHMKSGMYICM